MADFISKKLLLASLGANKNCGGMNVGELREFLAQNVNISKKELQKLKRLQLDELLFQHINDIPLSVVSLSELKQNPRFTATITFGEVGENHVGMEKIGQLAEEGFSVDDLKNAQNSFSALNLETELINLKQFLPLTEQKNKKIQDGYILIVRSAVDFLLEHNTTKNLIDETLNLQVDKHIYSQKHGGVVNKNARYNLVYSDRSQEPDYKNKKGRIVNFSTVPLTAEIRNKLSDFIGPKAEQLQAELNLYYNIRKCYIGFHGDTERKRVVGVRLGSDFPLEYQWYHQSKCIGQKCRLILKSGDLYVMSEKATGFDWKKRSLFTLRHAAGYRIK